VPSVLPKELAVDRIATHPYLLLQLWLIGYDMSSSRADYWNSDGAKELDNMSIEQWLQRQNQSEQWVPDELQAVRDWFWLMENFPPIQSNISALFGSVMLYKRTRFLSAEGFYLKGVFRWENGTGTFVNAIADAIIRLGGSISTSSQVTAIDYTDPNQVIVKLATGETMIAKKVVIATSLPSSSYISYNPLLPTSPNYMRLFQSITSSDNDAVQLIMTWSAKWYLTQGNIILPDPLKQPSCDVYGPVFEVTPSNSTDGILRIIVLDCARSYDCIILNATSNTTRDTKVTTSAKNWFKSVYSLLNIPVGSSPIDDLFIETDIWDWRTLKPLLPAMTYYYPPNGSLVAYGNALRASIANRIYWGGSERGVDGLHWMEGAIQRGNDVACEVLADIGLVPNCTIYSNWIQYMAHLARSTTRYQKLFNLYNLNLNNINQFVCQIVKQTGYECVSEKQPWRQPINEVEKQINTSLNAALAHSDQIEEQIRSAALLAGKIYGSNFFETKQIKT
jgi:hypothetical protein